MKESFVKVGGLFLPKTSLVLVTCSRFLVCSFRKVRSTSALKSFHGHSYFWNYNPSTNRQLIFLISAQAHPSTIPEGWMVQVVEYTQLNELKKKSNFNPIYKVSWVFFAGKQYMKTPIKRLHKNTQSFGTLSRMST